MGSPRPDRATNDAALAEIERMMGTDTTPTAAKSQEVATRLASMWNSAPDAALLRDATGNRLTEPATIERQVRRMLADDRAHAFISKFFVPWLQLDALAKADPDPCVNCHRNFFSLGYALENFDPIGGCRAEDQIGAVDASGVVDGTPTNDGVVEMRKVSMQRPEAFRTTITEKLLVYASTGSVDVASGTPETLVHPRQVLREVPMPRWSALIAAVVRQRR